MSRRDEGMPRADKLASLAVAWEARDAVSRVGTSIGCIVAGILAWWGWSGQATQPPAIVIAVALIVTLIGVLGLATEVVYPWARGRIAPRATRVEGARILDETRTLLPLTDAWWSDWELRAEKWRLEAHEAILRWRPELGRCSGQAFALADVPLGRYAGLLHAESRLRVHLMCDVLTAVIEGRTADQVDAVFQQRFGEPRTEDLFG